jgi:hypothetical protein
MPDCNKCPDYDRLIVDYDDKSKRLRIYRAALIEACNGDSKKVSELYQKHAELRSTLISENDKCPNCGRTKAKDGYERVERHK